MAFYIGSLNSTISTAVQMPEPAKEGITITDEPIWASNTGRAQDGTLVGDIISWKTTVAVTWPPLSFSSSQTLRNALVNNSPFFKIYYPDFSAGTMTSKVVYCSSLPRTLYSIATGHQRHIGVTVTFIEQ